MWVLLDASLLSNADWLVIAKCVFSQLKLVHQMSPFLDASDLIFYFNCRTVFLKLLFLFYVMWMVSKVLFEWHSPDEVCFSPSSATPPLPEPFSLRVGGLIRAVGLPKGGNQAHIHTQAKAPWVGATHLWMPPFAFLGGCSF